MQRHDKVYEPDGNDWCRSQLSSTSAFLKRQILPRLVWPQTFFHADFTAKPLFKSSQCPLQADMEPKHQGPNRISSGFHGLKGKQTSSDRCWAAAIDGRSIQVLPGLRTSNCAEERPLNSRNCAVVNAPCAAPCPGWEPRQEEALQDEGLRASVDPDQPRHHLHQQHSGAQEACSFRSESSFRAFRTCDQHLAKRNNPTNCTACLLTVLTSLCLNKYVA